MKSADFAELRSLTVPELVAKARETKEALFNLRFQLRTGHLSDFSQCESRQERVRSDSDGHQSEAPRGGKAWSSLT